jgi:2-polyprenyl-3-methyl-5-hydroxy-6-metoxy-1,4-benzoquinol methylase
LAEFKGQVFKAHNERSIEYRFALEALAESRPKSVLDVGAGITAWPHLLRTCGYVVTAIDNVTDYWADGMVNRHWAVRDLDITRFNGQKLNDKYEAVTCISVLEHIKDHRRAVANMASLLKPGGLMVLTTPFSYNTPHPNVYERADALWGKDLKYVCRSSSASELQDWLKADLMLIKRELWQLFTGPVWATGEPCGWKLALTEDEPHQLGCFVFLKK